ncbi:MAG: lysophospholipid acyltransferase family protein [Thermodesulfovibrionales bacterium]
MQRCFYLFFKVLFKIVFRFLFCLEVRGVENVPKKGGVIVAANHISYLDPPVIGVALRRQATYMAREGLFKIPLLRNFVAAFSFPVKRGRPRPSTIKEAVHRLKRGELIVMFPEGGRSENGRFLDPKRGVGLIATMSGAPVVPALIRGTERAFPVGARFIRPAKIRVVFGKPIMIESPGEAEKDFQERVAQDIMKAITKLDSEQEYTKWRS